MRLKRKNLSIKWICEEVERSVGLVVVFSLCIAMDLRVVMLVLALIFLQIRAEDSGSIFFLDGPNHQFLRTQSQDEPTSMSLSDVGAAISVLLGFSPPATLSEASSSKLNEVLSPNPFNRPRSVLILEVGDTEDQQLLMDHLGRASIRSKVQFESGKPEIQLPVSADENEISVASLDESLISECDAVCIDGQLHDLASLLGGSYVTNAREPLHGELTVSLATGTSLKLHMSKEADREILVKVVSLVRNIRKAIEMHEDLSRSVMSPAELLIGSFSGLKALKEKYGNDVSQQGMELFLTALTKLFDSLQEAYQGHIVGVLFFNVKPHVEFGSVLNVKLAARPSARWLEEKVNSTESTIVAEVALVRITLAWITGIIFLLSALLGIYYLMYMPLTRDTLLYSNVKLD